MVSSGSDATATSGSGGATSTTDNDFGAAGCVSAIPDSRGHVPPDACNSYYNFDPQTAPAVAVAVIFALLTTVHVVEAVAFKKVSWLALGDRGQELPAGKVSHAR